MYWKDTSAMFSYALSSLQRQVVRTAGAWSTCVAWPSFRSIEAKGSANCSKLDVLRNITGKLSRTSEFSPYCIICLLEFCLLHLLLQFIKFIFCTRHFDIRRIVIHTFWLIPMSPAFLDFHARNFCAQWLYMQIGTQELICISIMVKLMYIKHHPENILFNQSVFYFNKMLFDRIITRMKWP